MKLTMPLALLSLLALVTHAAPRQHLTYEPDAPRRPAANLFLNAKVTALRHWGDRLPHFAVDGKHDRPADHWAAENTPVWLTVDMGSEKELNLIRLWPYWDGRRHYQYRIDGSNDGIAWELLSDRTTNVEKGSGEGFTHVFTSRKVRYVRTTFTHNSAGNQTGGHIVEIEGYLSAPPGLHGTVASTDERYTIDAIPSTPLTDRWHATAWRGERVNAQFLCWASVEVAHNLRAWSTALRSEGGDVIPATALAPRFIRYVMADGNLQPDIIDTVRALDLPAGDVRPVWLSIDVPTDAPPATYHGKVTLQSDGGKCVEFSISLEVLHQTLPVPDQWFFHLDLWQNPFAVARYHRVAPWSKEHFLLMRPLLTRLAQAGQKILTCSILHQPWGAQTFDPFESMIGWTRETDGTWAYDYTVFDQWVDFGESCGIDKQVNCYSMIPWSNRFRYLDAATGDHKTITASPGSKAYEDHWRPFLTDFEKHLKQKGRLEKTTMAMDERPEKLMTTLLGFVRETAPGLKISSAANYTTHMTDGIYDLSIAIGHAHIADAEFLNRRSRSGQRTTFYVCCGPLRPNTFPFSPPAESEWLAIHAAAKGFDGLLRWAYCSWVEDPLMSADYVRWPSGDCFLVYPGDRTSIRFEKLRDGIEEYEKIRLLRAAASKRDTPAVQAALTGLNAALEKTTFDRVKHEPAAEICTSVRTCIEALARALTD